MTFRPLDAREWLEGQRLAGCEFADDLLDLCDGEERTALLESLCEGIEKLVPVDRRNPVTEKQFERLEEAVTERVHLLESLEEIISKFSEGFEFPADIIDTDDKLRAMLESPRWQKYDL